MCRGGSGGTIPSSGVYSLFLIEIELHWQCGIHGRHRLIRIRLMMMVVGILILLLLLVRVGVMMMIHLLRMAIVFSRGSAPGIRVMQ